MIADGWMVAGALGSDDDARLLVADADVREALVREDDRCCEDDIAEYDGNLELVGGDVVVWVFCCASQGATRRRASM